MDFMEFWRNFTFQTDNMVIFTIIVGLATAVFYIGKRIYMARIKGKEHRHPFLIQLLRHAERPVKILFLLSLTVALLRQFFPEFTESDWYHNLYSIAVILIFTWIILKAIGIAADLIVRQFNVSIKDNLKARRVHTQVRVLRRLAAALTILISIAACLMVFEQIRSLGVSLIASAGVAGLVLGLAAQKTLGNFFTGLQIAITQPIRIEDAVVVEGEWGWIEEINLTYVVVKIWDQRRLILPISYFVDKPFQNWTRTSSDILGPIILYVDYAMPVEPLREELDRLLESEKGQAMWDGKVKVIQVIEVTEKSMQLRILVSAPDSPTAWDLRCFIREGMITFVQKNYPQHLPRHRAEWPDLKAIDKTSENAVQN